MVVVVVAVVITVAIDITGAVYHGHNYNNHQHYHNHSLSLMPSIPQVVYNNSYPVNFGAVLTPTQVQSQPTFLRWPCRGDSLYTLVFLGESGVPRSRDFCAGFGSWRRLVRVSCQRRRAFVALV